MDNLRRILIAIGIGLACQAVAAAELEALMRQCAPQVHPTTLKAIVRQESAGHAYVLSDDGPAKLPWRVRKNMLRSFYPASKEEAVRLAETLTAQGHMVGIGLTQISNRHLQRFGMTVRDALEPCTNLQIGAQLLTEIYVNALKSYTDPQAALLAAISAWNTGSYENGFSNGYVAKVVSQAQYQVPEIKLGNAAGLSKPGMRVASRSGKVGHKAASRLATARENGLLAAKFATLEVESY